MRNVDIVISQKDLEITEVNGIPFTPVLKLIYFYIVSQKNAKGVTCISQDNIRYTLGITRPSVWKHIKKLVNMGLLTKEGDKNSILEYKALPLKRGGYE